MIAFSSLVMRSKAPTPSFVKGGSNLHHAGTTEDVFKDITTCQDATRSDDLDLRIETLVKRRAH